MGYAQIHCLFGAGMYPEASIVDVHRTDSLGKYPGWRNRKLAKVHQARKNLHDVPFVPHSAAHGWLASFPMSGGHYKDKRLIIWTLMRSLA